MSQARHWQQTARLATAQAPSSAGRDDHLRGTEPAMNMAALRPSTGVKPGDSIEDYRVDKKLGQGATGQVFKCYGLRGPLRNKIVAIKIIQKALLSSAKRRDRVADEIAVHKALPPHPAIVRFEHAFEDEAQIYICTEYCAGSTVFAYLQENYPTGLSEAQAAPIFLSLVQAVSFMHLNEMMHRDLKLSNVLLTDTLQVKIADFGLATRLRDASVEQDMTMCGTPNYISPEIVNRAPYGVASDVWSLGCILVALLTGKPPFQGEHVSETLQLVSKGAYRPLPRGVSRDVKNLVAAILQTVPERRLTTAEMMAHPFLAAAAQRDTGISPLAPTIAADLSMASPRRQGGGEQHRPLPDFGVPFHTPGRKAQLAESLNRERPKMSDLLGKPSRPVYTQYIERQRRPSVDPEDGRPARPHVTTHYTSTQPRARLAAPRETGMEEGDSTWEEKQVIRKHQQMVPRSPPRQSAQERPVSSHRRSRSSADLQQPRDRYLSRAYEAYSLQEQDVQETQEEHRYDRLRRSDERDNHDARFRHPPERAIRKSRSFDQNPIGAATTQRDARTTASEPWASPQRPILRGTNRFTQRAVSRANEAPLRARFGMQPLPNVVEEILKEDAAREAAQRQQALWSKGSQQSSAASSTTEDPSLAMFAKYRFSTAGLKPASQVNKYGEMAIQEDGTVSVVLAKGGQAYGISADGMYVSLTSSEGAEQRYPLADLPARHLLAYRYASKFINLVRSKTIRIAINAADARSRLYENDHFEVVLVNEGRKVAFDPASRVIKVADREEVLYKGYMDLVPECVRESVSAAMTWYTRCHDALGQPASTSDASRDTEEMFGLPTTSGTAETKFLDGIGWCEKHAGGQEWIFYLLDGTRLSLDTVARLCTLENREAGQKEEHVLASGLPRHVRHRLKLAGAAMKQFV